MLILQLTGCSLAGIPLSNDPPFTKNSQSEQSEELAWSSQFDRPNWQQEWDLREEGSWGWENLEVLPDESGRFERVLRVRYPAGSASPRVWREEDAPLGGTQFYADLGIPPQDALRLSYYVRFSENFDFVKGGKLPGLFGGTVHSGGDIPDGTNGFSTRYMWRRRGKGELYAYLPDSEDYGTSIGRGSWTFTPGEWYHLEQVVTLNRPGERDGKIQVFVNGKQVFARANLLFRTIEDLKIEGIFFSTFFGGGDSSWATPTEVYVDFAEFSVTFDSM